jgi:hypothetical protein
MNRMTYKEAQEALVAYDKSHGSPFDRGSADSYYNRPIDPHWYPQGTYNADRVDEANMSDDQVAAYMAGFWYNEQFGDKKNYE